MQFFQTKDYVVIFNEMIHDARIVPLDGRQHEKVPRWMGDSTGHWEGSTLVVDAVNFTDRDPTIWTRRTWTAAVPLTRTDEPMYEYACHEGNTRSVEGC